MATHSNNHYYVPHGSVYPSIISLGLLSLASGFIFSVATDKSKELAYLQAPGKWMMICLGFFLLNNCISQDSGIKISYIFLEISKEIRIVI